MTRSPLARTLAALSAAVSHYSPASPAWLDFVAECQDRLPGINDDAIVPADMWDYWASVAAGENGDYDANGARKSEPTISNRPVETIDATELVGRRIRVLVYGAPRRVFAERARPLTQTTVGTVTLFAETAAGPVGFLKTDDGEIIAFDCGGDIGDGRVAIEMIKG